MGLEVKNAKIKGPHLMRIFLLCYNVVKGIRDRLVCREIAREHRFPFPSAVDWIQGFVHANKW